MDYYHMAIGILLGLKFCVLIFIGFLLHDKSKDKYRDKGCSNRRDYKRKLKAGLVSKGWWEN